MFMTCIIKTANDKGNLTRKDTLIRSIYYTVNELKNRGYKTTDYKKLYNKLNKKIIESGLKKVYTAKHLD